MSHASKKQHLVSALRSLASSWDFATPLVEMVSRDDFPASEIDELYAIVSEATDTVKAQSDASQTLAIQNRIREMYEREKHSQREERHDISQHLHIL